MQLFSDLTFFYSSCVTIAQPVAGLVIVFFLHSASNLCAVIFWPVIILYISCVTFVRVFLGLVFLTFQNETVLWYFSDLVLFFVFPMFIHLCGFYFSYNAYSHTFCAALLLLFAVSHNYIITFPMSHCDTRNVRLIPTYFSCTMFLRFFTAKLQTITIKIKRHHNNGEKVAA